MRIIIARHGDPDYENDTLTEKGWREAEYLSEVISKLDIKDIYVSPLGRAKDTASLSLKKLNREGQIKDWLREFDAPIEKPNLPGEKSITWDWLPQDWMMDPCFFNIDTWLENKALKEANVEKEYNWVISEFDKLLKAHGYTRNGRYYDAVSPNNDTIVFFCHFGLECVLLSHLLNISPMILWHATAAAPTSLTVVYTEERRPGIASMRMAQFGDQSHLYMNSEEPSFSARFRACYTNEDERLD